MTTVADVLAGNLREAVEAARDPKATPEDKAWADFLLYVCREAGETSGAQVLARMGLE